MTLLSIQPIVFVSMPGASEWIFILIAIVVLFGGKKIPELAKGIGKGMREFKEAKDGITSPEQVTANEKAEPLK